MRLRDDMRHILRSITIREDGFTLVELTIVLLIISLIIGGVLTGRDLIEVAKLRMTLAQLEKLEVATHTFRGKYQYHPGDILQSKAVAYGLTQGTCSAGSCFAQGCFGDGDGIMDSVWSGTAGGFMASDEVGNVFFHLSRANLIEGQYTKAHYVDLGLCSVTQGGNLNSADDALPRAKIIGHIVSSDWDGAVAISLKNSFVVGYNFTSIGGSLGSTFAQDINSLTAFQAFWMDAKIDDGKPHTNGKIRRWTPPVWPTAACAALDEYNITNPNRTCMIQYRWK